MAIFSLTGSPTGDFCLPGSDNKEHCLKDYRGKKLVLFFYPKDNTSGWTKEAVAFRDHADFFEKLNISILGINRDSIASHQKFAEKYELPYILLSDVDSAVCNAFGVIKEKNMYGKISKGIERSTFVLDENGLMLKEYRKVKVDGHVESIIIFLKGQVN